LQTNDARDDARKRSKELVTLGGGYIAMRLPARSAGREHSLALGVSVWFEEIQCGEGRIVKLMRRAIRDIELSGKEQCCWGAARVEAQLKSHHRLINSGVPQNGPRKNA
jgi:hypothetical protein